MGKTPDLTDIADTKKRFPELINRSAFSDCRGVITKRNRPVPAIVRLENLHCLQQNKNPQGLKAAIGKWEGFEEIADAIDDAVRARRSEENPGLDHRFGHFIAL